MKKTIITLLILIATIGIIGWVLLGNKKENEETIKEIAASSGTVAVTVDTVKSVSLGLNFTSNGNFAPMQDLNLSAENNGQVTKLYVNEGAHVSRGQVLARIDDKFLQLDVNAAQEALSRAKIDQDRYQSSFETGGVTQSQLDDVNLNVRNLSIKLEQANKHVQDSYVKAPINGVVNKREVELGTYVNVGTPLFEIVDVSKLKLKVSVNESQVVSLKKGDEVTITSSVFPGKAFSGFISFIATKSEETLNYPVEIEVNPSQATALKAGMYATATFTLPQQDDAILIPRTAFIGGVNSNQIYVLKNGKEASLRKVTAGNILGEKVQVLQGLYLGDIVITSGQINLVEGTEVTITK